MKNIFKLIFAASLSLVMVCCSDDFLNVPPKGAFNATELNDADGVNKALTAAYSRLKATNGAAPQGSLFALMRGGELHKGSNPTDQAVLIEFEKHEIATANTFVLNFWTTYYDAVFRTNLVLQSITTATGMSDAQKLQATAEARFLRGHFYFQLKRVFKNIPWIDETTEDVRVPNTDEAGNYVNIWQNIQDDFDFARKNLTETKTEVGRANKWAAEVYYAKVLIYRGNEENSDARYMEALTVLNTVIASGKTAGGAKYALMPYYHDNFNADKENNAEGVFAVQLSVNDGTANGQNGNPESQYAGIYRVAGSGQKFGFYQPTQWAVDHFRVDANGLPFLDMFGTNPASVKSDDGTNPNAPFVIDTNPVDPRLDWSIGRRGIPFLDWGLHGGAGWVRDPAHAGPYTHKKWMYYKKDEGRVNQLNSVFHSINIPIIRFAEVLLFAAEVEARVGSLSKARDYVNQVRNRMVLNSTNPENWVQNATGTGPAANYKIGLYPATAPAFASKDAALGAILYERSLELNQEGHRFYDLQRFGAAQQEITAYLAFESKLRGYLAGGSYSPTPDAIAPIPFTAVTNSQKAGEITLKQNPGY